MGFWIVRSTVWVVLHTIFFFYGGIRFEGRNNVPRKGGVLITPNHISDGDPPAMGIAVPRSCYFMAKEELFELPVWGKLIRWLHGFPVKRYTADRAALRFAEDLLKKGEAVVIFPEGKISEDGALQEMLPGALLIARRAGVPIVPTALINTDDLMPYRQLWPRHIKKPVIVRFGPPITMKELLGNESENEKGSESLKLASENLRECIRAVLENRPYPNFAIAPSTDSATPSLPDTTPASR